MEPEADGELDDAALPRRAVTALTPRSLPAPLPVGLRPVKSPVLDLRTAEGPQAPTPVLPLASAWGHFPPDCTPAPGGPAAPRQRACRLRPDSCTALPPPRPAAVGRAGLLLPPHTVSWSVLRPDFPPSTNHCGGRAVCVCWRFGREQNGRGPQPRGDSCLRRGHLALVVTLSVPSDSDCHGHQQL